MEILMYEGSHARVQGDLARIAPHACAVRVARDGSLQREGEVISPEQAHLEVAWASPELYVLGEQGPVRSFMIALLKSKTVRWLQSGAAGFDHPVFGTLSRKGIRITNSDASSIAIAEFVMASVLDLYQGGDARREAQREGRWEHLEFREVYGSRWLVVGLGGIGREVALRARAFGAHVVGVRRHPRGDEPVEVVVPDRIAEPAAAADVMVLCAPLTSETRGMVDGGLLDAMKPGSLLVNVARGALVDEAALARALDRGAPGWAVLDVFETEPLPPASPLWSHPRIRVSAHCAAAGSGITARSDALFLRNLERYLAGEPLAMEVDPSSLAT